MASHLAFTALFYYVREGMPFWVSPHHKIVASALDRVFSGEITRLIINVPPGYTKTELAVINFIAHGFAINPRSLFIHSSYSRSLVLNNSAKIKQVIESEEYQRLWEYKICKDTKAKQEWYFDYDGGSKVGGMYAVSAAGSVTGFRAGRLDSPIFSGCLVLDDLMKPEQASSNLVREGINSQLNSTLLTRLANPSIPVVLIMQRIHEQDSTGFLLSGGSGEKWHHLCLPVLIDNNNSKYPKEYTHGIPIEYDLPNGALWAKKHTLHDISLLRQANRYNYSAQYEQRPTPKDGGLFKTKWWKHYKTTPQFEYRYITADTAMKTGTYNDYSVMQCWGLSESKVYLIDQVRGKFEAPELQRQAIYFWSKHIGAMGQRTGMLRYLYIEDKSSGTGLIQAIRQDKDYAIPVRAIQRNTDKITRANDVIPYIEAGRVYLPEKASWLSDFLLECEQFTPTKTHRHDDQVDAMMDGVFIGLMNNKRNNPYEHRSL